MDPGSLTDALRETLVTFDEPGIPLTTTEVADRLDLGRRSTFDRLERLADGGHLETKKVGARGRVWWRPPDGADRGASGRTLSRLIGSVPGMVYRCRNETGWPMPFVSEAATDITGYEPAAIESGEVSWGADVVHPDDRATLREDVNAQLDAGDQFVVEYRIRTADGETRWVRSRGCAVAEASGGSDVLEGVVTDVTEEARSKRALARREQQFRSLVEATEEYAIFMLDPEGRVQTWNEGARQIKGYERDEIVGEHYSTFYTEDDAAAGVPQRNLAGAVERGAVEDEGWRVRQDGSRFWANVTLTAIADEHGELRGFAKVTRDMTDRREHEQQLRRERDLVEQVFETSPVGLGVLSRDGLERVNARAAGLFGSPTDDVDGPAVGDLAAVDADGRPVPPEERPDARVFETGEPVEAWECRFEGADGRRRWLSVSAAPLRDGDDVERVVVATEDITRLKEQARQLERQRDELEAELDEVFERVDDAFYALDEQFRFTHVNERAGQLLQAAEEQLLGESVWERYPEATESPAWDAFHRAMETQEPTGYEVYYEPLEFWVEANVYPSETGLSVYFRDVTERKERELELERYEAIFDAVGDAICVVDERQRFQDANRAAEELSGYDREELLGSHVSELVGEAAADRALEFGEDPTTDGQSVAATELALATADGDEVPIDARFTRLPTESGRVEHVGVARDISERRARERELERRVRQQEVVTELGQQALEERDLDALFDRAVELVADTLGNAYCKVLDLHPDEEALLLRAGVGWREGLVGTATVGTERGSQAGYTLLSQDPVIVEDLASEERFSGPELLTSHDVVSGISTVIGPVSDPWGVLGTHDTERRDFSVRDVRFVQSVATILATAIERAERQRELERYEAIVETVTDGVYAADDHYRFAMVNDAYAEMVGYDRDELVGRHVSTVVGDEAVALGEARREKLLAGTDDTGSVELELETATGETISVESRYALLPAGDTFAGTVGVVRDITERKARERALRESERRNRTLVDNFPNGVVALFDPDLRHMLVGGTLLEVIDLSIDEVEGKTVREVFPPTIADQIEPHFRAVFDGETREFEVEAGDRVRAFRVSPVRDDDGEIVSGLGVSQDVTDRVERQRELERQRERLRAINELNGIVRGLTEAVIDQSTREEIETVVCEGLASTDSYEFAWIGDVDGRMGTMRVRTEAGVDGYLDDRSISAEGEDPERAGPIPRAVQTHEMQVVEDIFDDDAHERWRQPAREWGYQSAAVIPIVHDDVLHGVLCVYAARPHAFSGGEYEVIGHLGEVVGHAIAAVERKRALTSSEVVELQFQVPRVFDAFDLPAADGRLSIERSVPVGDGSYLVYGTATDDMLDVLDGLVETHPNWESVRLLGTAPAEGGARFESRLVDPPVLSTVTALGGYVERARIENGDSYVRVHLSPSVDARRLLEVVREDYPMARLVSRQQISRDADSPTRLSSVFAEHLTDRQRSALEAAYFGGYFEWPRDAAGEEVAGALGVSAPTFHQHLRNAQRKLLQVALDDAPVG